MCDIIWQYQSSANSNESSTVSSGFQVGIPTNISWLAISGQYLCTVAQSHLTYSVPIVDTGLYSLLQRRRLHRINSLPELTEKPKARSDGSCYSVVASRWYCLGAQSGL